MDAPIESPNTAESALSMFRPNGPMMITGGHYTISTSTSPASPSPHAFRQVLLDLFEKHVALSATHDTIDDHRSARLSPSRALSPAHSLLLSRLLSWARDTSPHPTGQPPFTQTFHMPPISSEDDGACAECKMRDLDMADVDVTSPGVWERDSDSGIDIYHSAPSSGRGPRSNDTADASNDNGTDNDNDGAQTPRRKVSFADPPTESNLKTWLKEPSHGRKGLVRMHILTRYLESQLELRAERAVHVAAEDALQTSQAPNVDLGDVAAEGQQVSLAPATPAHERSDSLHETQSQNQPAVNERHDPCEASIQTSESGNSQPPSARHPPPGPDSSVGSTPSEPSSIFSSSASYTTTTTTTDTEAQSPLAADDRHPRIVAIEEAAPGPVSWMGRFTGVLTSPLDGMFDAWTTLCVQEWP